MKVAVQGYNALYCLGLARWNHPHRIAHAHRARGYQVGEAAEVQVGPIDPLHRHRKGLGLIGLVPLITALAGRCPAYSMMGIKTCAKSRQ